MSWKIKKFRTTGGIYGSTKEHPWVSRGGLKLVKGLDFFGISSAGMVACQCYRQQYGEDNITVIPTNLYGPGDNFDLKNSHVLPRTVHISG